MKKILIVEDELAYLKLLQDQLVIHGYQVVDAKNGKTGLVVAKRENPDLIVLDIRLPIMDGMTMLRLLRKEPSLKRTKVIILTNLEPDSKIIDQVVNGQPSYYFIKSDVHLNELLEKIKDLLVD